MAGPLSAWICVEWVYAPSLEILKLGQTSAVHQFNLEEVQALPEHEFRQTHAALRTDLLVPSGRSGLFEFMP